MSDEFHDLLSQEMDRQQFLLIAGTGLLSLLGVSRFLKLFGKNHASLSRSGGSNQLGYSAGDYGGKSGQ